MKKLFSLAVLCFALQISVRAQMLPFVGFKALQLGGNVMTLDSGKVQVNGKAVTGGLSAAQVGKTAQDSALNAILKAGFNYDHTYFDTTSTGSLTFKPGSVSGGAATVPAVTFTNNTGTGLTVNWTSVNALYYQLYRYPAGSTTGTLIHTGNDYLFNDTGLTASTAYNYSVVPVFGAMVTTASGNTPGYSTTHFIDFSGYTSAQNGQPASNSQLNFITNDNAAITYNNNVTITNPPSGNGYFRILPSGNGAGGDFIITITGLNKQPAYFAIDSATDNLTPTSYSNGTAIYQFSVADFTRNIILQISAENNAINTLRTFKVEKKN